MRDVSGIDKQPNAPINTQFMVHGCQGIGKVRRIGNENV
jgi:hypothetical protein